MLATHRQLYAAALPGRSAEFRPTTPNKAHPLKAIRAFDQDAGWLNYSSIQHTLRRLDQALAAFFRRVTAGETAGYPRFNSRRRFNSVEYRSGDGARFQANRPHVQKVSAIKVNGHRHIPAAALLKTVCLKRTARTGTFSSGRNCRTFQPPVHPGPAAGLETGLNTRAALSDGTLIDNPRHFRTAEDKPAGIVAWQHQPLANQRRDYARQLARYRTDTFAVEDLNIHGLAQSALANFVHDAGWAQRYDLLAYKVERTSSQLLTVDAGTRATGAAAAERACRKTCGCACLRVLHGLTFDRDVNAARNILSLALNSFEAQPEPSAVVPRSRPL